MGNERYGERPGRGFGGYEGRRNEDRSGRGRPEGDEYGDYPHFDEGRRRASGGDRDIDWGGRGGGDDPWAGRGPRSGGYAGDREQGRGGSGQRHDRPEDRYPPATGWEGGRGRGFMERASDEMSSWFGDDAAAQRRRSDQHRGKGPQGYSRSDSRIEEDLNDRLTEDPELDASRIEVTVSAGEVTLNGQVGSRWDKRRAEDCADAVSGVKHVQNNLRVAPEQDPKNLASM